MEEQQKQAVKTPTQTTSETASIASTEVSVEPAISQPEPPKQEFNPEEWFAPDKPVTDTGVKNARFSKKRLLVMAAILSLIFIVSGGFIFAAVQKTKKQIEPASYEESQNIGSSESDAQLSPEETQETVPPNNTTAPAPSNATTQTSSGSGGGIPSSGSTSKTYVMTYTFNGCYVGSSGSNITIKSGDAIKFVNGDSKKDMWPASDRHPEHDDYGINNEFDAGYAITPGGNYSFTFTKKGIWGYHDHLKSSCGGSITVQ